MNIHIMYLVTNVNHIRYKAVLPNKAFISNFTMVVNGIEYVAEVKSKVKTVLYTLY